MMTLNHIGRQMNKRETHLPSDADSPDQWVDLYGDYLFRYALARVANADTAEDIVQEALVAAVQAHKRFQGRSSIKTWLVSILKRKIVDYYRRKSSQMETEDIEAVANRVDGLFDESGHWRSVPAEWSINPGQAYEQKEFMGVIYKCMAKLPKRLAEIFMMREFDDMDTQTICEQMGISESNSWVMLYRARMQLRGCLEKNWLSANQ
jgi:RNA polymerase sigma-70 factor (ECF subfamily)